MSERRINKLCFVIGDLSFGGSERVVSTLANCFIDNGIEVTIFCIGRNQSQVEYWLNPKIKVTFVHGTPGVFGKISQLWRLRCMIKSLRPDSIIAFQEYINIQAIIACYGLGIPVTISIRQDPAVSSMIYKISTRFFYRFAHSAVFQTREQQYFYKACKNRKDIVILNPVDLSKIISASCESKIKSNNIVTVGRLAEQKNFKLLLKAFCFILEEFPEMELIIWGEGEQREELELISAGCGLEKQIHFPGVTDNVFPHVANARMFVMTSLYEGLPNALIEAMCLGVPCISTHFSGGGAEMLIEDGVNGLLVPSEDCEALVRAMSSLLSDNEFAQRIGDKAKEMRQRVDTVKIMNEWLDLIRGIMK